ncbi:MAG: O-sialoglycoprotein endopeptidase [Tissierellia bacterium]|nr:O-sialoglycoprotein endopeptidase [Tissierellia bacterium]
MRNRYFMGIDTSNYTTSIALIDDMDNIILDLRKVLKVDKGKKGLRQQEAVFQHVNNFPELFNSIGEQIDFNNIYTVSCSHKPRNVKESYMPVFRVGRGQALIMSKVLKANYYEFSHQEGHIAAGIMYNELKDKSEFLSLHISGGTTELLLVNRKNSDFNIDIIGGTLDISIGQLIDRIGVEMGLNFPCGKEMDDMSKKGNVLELKIPISIKDDTWFNLSGLENYFKNLLHDDKLIAEDVLATFFNSISLYLIEIIVKASKIYGINSILITGGVAANSTIRKLLQKELNRVNISVYFPKIELCTDNAIGIAYLGKVKAFSR